ncbi:MAG: hypothetical protein WBI07_09625 [Mobilitalea sp.]
MMNPAKLLKLKGAWGKFTQNHPKFPQFLRAASSNAVQEGSLIDIKITTTDGRSINTNLKLTASDIELFHELSEMSR